MNATTTMNWLDASGLTSLARSALKEAQKTLDKALDIQDDGTESPPRATASAVPPARDSADFFSSWGLTTSGESTGEPAILEQPIITESPSKATAPGIWGSFAGSFFEPTPTISGRTEPGDAVADVETPSIRDSERDTSTNAESPIEDGRQKTKPKPEEMSIKSDERAGSSRLNRLSLVSVESGINSSDSVEVLGSQSLKTTPDSEIASIHSISHSSGAGLKHNSESVEILPDSLVSPSSIECLGFDSFYSERSSNECSSSNISPLDEHGDKKSTPTCHRTEQEEKTADSFGLVADDDDDTISYNSVSECTAPTILDTNGEDNISPSANPRLAIIRNIPDLQRSRHAHIKDGPDQLSLSHSQMVQQTENYASSNDGSWSDRTLNADNESITLEPSSEDKGKVKSTEKALDAEVPEDTFMDKLSDSSSFYNVNVGDNFGSDHTPFVNVDQTLCTSPLEGTSSKDKERVSPISSESRSDLVKIGSDRTSTHTSGDELETATSSDIEIIPSPNGDNGHMYCRASPAKYALKNTKLDRATSPNLVDLVLGKTLVTKMRGHNRELSEASIQSSTSDESHSSENERLLRRLCEMAEVLEARELKLLEMSRNNAELSESNAELKGQVESLMGKQEAGDIYMITEDYSQRMSALEKKFQQAIREKDQLRKQMDVMKGEMSRRNSADLESTMKEKDEMIVQLQEEGEKLSKQQFTQSNIIKKLRVKEKENEQVIKSLRHKIAEQSSELDRLKRSLSAKEELEVNQIEAVYRLNNANKKLDTELVETKSALEDALHKLETSRTSLEAARKELVELQRSSWDASRRRDALAELEREKEQADLEIERLKAQLENLRAKMIQEERGWAGREEALRRELGEARAAAAALEARAAEGAAGGAGGGAGLLAQLATLQHSALERDGVHRAYRDRLTSALAEAERKLSKAVEMERLAREACDALRERLSSSEAARAEAQGRLEGVAEQGRQCRLRLQDAEDKLTRKIGELEHLRTDMGARVSELEKQLGDTLQTLEAERALHEAEKKRNAILQEQLVMNVSRSGDVSPPRSVASDTLSASLWTQEEGSETGGAGSVAGSVFGLEEVLARLQRREGEVRALAAAADARDRQLQAATDQLADMRHQISTMQAVQEQYDAVLQMYGEKEEQVQELELDLQDVTQLYKSQLDEIIALKRRLASVQQ